MVRTMNKRLYAFLFLLILPFIVSSSQTLADEGDGRHSEAAADSDGAPPKGTPRPPAEPVSDQVYDLFEKNFGLPKKYYQDTYKDSLAKAIQGVQLPEVDADAEKMMGKIAAQLFGTLNEKQFESLKTELATERKAIEDVPETSRTVPQKQKLEVVKRLQWGLKLKKPALMAEMTPPAPRFGPFTEGFRPEDAIVEKNNAEFHDLKKKGKELTERIKTATEPEKSRLIAERDAIRTKLMNDFNETSAFNDFQNDTKRNGDPVLAQDLQLVLSNLNGKSHFYEGTDPTSGKSFRIDLGEDPAKFNKAFDEGKAELAKQGVQVRGARLSPTPVASPAVSFRPPSLGVRPPDAFPTTTPPTGTEPPKEVKEFAATMKKFGCVACHTAGKNLPEMDENGFVKDKSDATRDKLINVFLKNDAGPGGMKRAVTEIRKDEAARKSIEAWSKFRGKDLTLPTASLDPATVLPGDRPKTLTAALKDGFAKEKISPEAFAKEIADGKAPKHILNVGDVGSVKGSTVVGPFITDEWIARFNAWEKSNPDARSQPVALYCGCCEAETCPNLLPALALLRERGYSNVRAVEMNNFDTDWKDKSHPMS